MGFLEITAAAALAMAASSSGGAAAEAGLNEGRMKQACSVAAAEEFDTSQGLIMYAKDAHVVRQKDGSYRIDGTADRKFKFRCVFNNKGHFNSVQRRPNA